MRIGERIYFGRPSRRFNDISSRTLRRFAFGLRFVCEMCARPEGFVREFCQTVPGRAANFPTAFRQSFPQLCRHTVCTPEVEHLEEGRNLRLDAAQTGFRFGTQPQPRREGIWRRYAKSLPTNQSQTNLQFPNGLRPRRMFWRPWC